MEDLLITVSNFLDSSEYCTKDELCKELAKNEPARKYINQYCECADNCDKCWSLFVEKVIQGDFDVSEKIS